MAKVAEEDKVEVEDETTNLNSITNSVEILNNLSTPILPWDRFSQWVYGICIVMFDLEVGQAMEMIYPGHIKLTEKEKANICYLSFPDSNSGCMGDTQFHFRIRQCSGWRRRMSTHCQFNQDCPVSIQAESNHLFGFVYFRQVKDRTQPRGYFQKSVVLLTKLPLVNLFYKVAWLVAPEYFDNGEPSIEAACHDLDQWPSPIPGELCNLPLMGTVLQTRIPSKLDKTAQAVPTSSQDELNETISNRLVLPAICEPDLFSYLSPVVHHIHLLWELILLGEPVVVMASSPAVCSQTVQSLVSIICPLKFCCDYRPYFTIHDSEFKEFTTKTQSPPPVILGVTNPFFAKTLQHWPHIIRLGDAPPSCNWISGC
ncbi:Protein dennd6a, variant 2 [Chamberlinius hualienensis]